MIRVPSMNVSYGASGDLKSMLFMDAGLCVAAGIPWLGFVVYPTHRLLKRRNVVNFTRRLARNFDLFRAGRITFAELDASVQGWINHVRYADTWGLREHVLAQPLVCEHPSDPPVP